MSDRSQTAPPVIYINHYAGEGGQWFLKRHGTKYIPQHVSDAAKAAARAAGFAEGFSAALRWAADEAEDHKLFANGADCLAECIRAAIPPETLPVTVEGVDA